EPQPDGKLLLSAAGGDGSGNLSRTAAVRATASGALDPSFGSGGVISTTIPSAPNTVGASVLQPDGRLVIAAAVGQPSSFFDRFALLRLTAYSAPSAALEATPPSGPSPLQTSLSTVGSSDPDGDIQVWRIAFGDGSPDATGSGLPPASIAHTYASEGMHTASLTLTDNTGLSSQATAVITVDKLGRVFYFAEGTVRPGFVEYITLQNPGAGPVDATLEFQAADDGGNVVALAPAEAPIAAASRSTFSVNDYVAAQGISAPLNVSVRVTSPSPIVAERPMYFAADPALGTVVDGGTDMVGAPALSTTFNFAEGTIRPGFVEYLTLQNPGLTGASAQLAFPATNDGGAAVSVPGLTMPVPAGGRVTLNVGTYLAGLGVPTPINLSVAVQSSQPILVERPLYFAADPGVGV